MASPNISFDTLPSSIRKPGKYFEFNHKLAVRTLPGNVQRVLIVAQRNPDAPHPALVPVDVYSDVQARLLAGQGSQAHLMVRAAIKASPYLRLDMILVDDDPAGLAAEGKVTLAGTATGSGVVSLAIGNELVRVAVLRDDTAAVAASGLAEVINKHERLPVTAVANAGVLTLTARNKGAMGNLIPLVCTETVPDMDVTVAPMAGGDVDPDISEALAKVFAVGHNIVITPYAQQESLTVLREHLDAASHALEQRGCIGVYAWTGTMATGNTLARKINSGRITYALVPGSASLPWEVAAAYGAVIASEEDPARPLNTLPLTGIACPPVDKRLGRVEQETALYNGGTPLEVGPGDKVQIVRAISTYVLDPQGIEDISLLDITSIRTLDYIRKACRERISLRFPREKLSERTPPKVRSELIDVLLKLEELEIVECVKDNLPALLVERDSQDPNRLNSKIPADIVNGLHVFAAVIEQYL